MIFDYFDLPERDNVHTEKVHVQMNEFPEEHVKVLSWELFILHIAGSYCLARGL